MNPDEQIILDSAIDHYGKPAQVLKCIEECAELIIALQLQILACDGKSCNLLNEVFHSASSIKEIVKKSIAHEGVVFNEVGNYNDIKSELADVSIMLDQMSNDKMVGSFKEERELKINRLDKKIKQDG